MTWYVQNNFYHKGGKIQDEFAQKGYWIFFPEDIKN